MCALLSPDYWMNQQKAIITKTKRIWELYKTLSHQGKGIIILQSDQVNYKNNLFE